MVNGVIRSPHMHLYDSQSSFVVQHMAHGVYVDKPLSRDRLYPGAIYCCGKVVPQLIMHATHLGFV